VSRWALFRAVFKQGFTQTRRYVFDWVTQMLVIYVIFLLIFYGAKAFIGTRPDAGDTLSGIVVAYLTWFTAIAAYGEVSFDLSGEAAAGTLEQLAMSPFGLPMVLTMRFVAGLVLQLVFIFAFLIAIMATSGRWLHLDMVSVVPLMILVIAGVFGVGLMLGGAAIVFKRVQALLNLMQFGFVALVAIPVTTVPVLKYLPLSWGNHLITQVMVDRVSIFDMPAGDLRFLVAHAAIWFGAGLVVFRRLERIARDRALLGQY
jgi:ABC-2 type transport system permease protein